MRTFSIFFIFITIFSFCKTPTQKTSTKEQLPKETTGQSETTPSKQNFFEHIRSFNSLQYEVEYYLASNPNAKGKFIVDLIKKEEDKKYGYTFRIRENLMFLQYNGNELMSVDHDKKATKIYDNLESYIAILPTLFPLELKNAVEKTPGEFHFENYILYYNSKSNLPIRAKTSGDDPFYFDFKNIKYNQLNLTASDLWNSESRYKVEYTNLPPKDKEGFIAKNSYAPNFNIKIPGGGGFSLYNTANAVTIVDFWYLRCKPCLKAMPYLQELHKKYAKDGLIVIGVNPVDHEIPSSVTDYLSKNGITYPTHVTSDTLDQLYHISNYPTLYVLDKNKRVVYSQSGYDEFEKVFIEQAIVNALKKK